VLFAPVACTTFDGLSAAPEVMKGTCGDHCSANGVAPSPPPSTTDGVKNGAETDIDCGGSGAPKCAAGKSCLVATDCVWGFCTAGVCEAHKPGRKDGDQTDVDCGGTMSPPCDWDKACLVDTDCSSQVCGADKKCLTGPSCRTEHGGSTCGSGEFGDPGAQHESCCRSLPVPGFTDPRRPGKKVYLDKYEITAGRMRVFIDAMTKAGGGVPNVSAYMAAHRPPRWNPGWELTLPQDFDGAEVTYTVASPTVDPLYPGEDFYEVNSPFIVGQWGVRSGTYSIVPGVAYALGGAHFFPEYYAAVPAYPSYDYAASHNTNCSNDEGGYGYSTYWFDEATLKAHDSGVGKFFSKDVLDEKALNCTPFGLFAAFCAWDGGELMSTEVFDFVAGGDWPAKPGGYPEGPPPTPPRLAGANTQCGDPPNTLNTFTDGTFSCPDVYYYPDDGGNTFDGSSRIAPPGRVPADTVALNEGDEPWMDLKGNLVEAVLKPDGIFDYRGYGVAYTSLQFHRNQITTPRMKGGSFGARCVRFK
jgi:hypothetical protein